MGYAYPAADSDNDGLIDGFELVVGTDPWNADSTPMASQTALNFRWRNCR
jgi:hypothetical protein